MLVTGDTVSRAEFEKNTGWTLKPEGACKGDVCIPLPESLQRETLDVRTLADAMGLPLAEAPEHGLKALGPESIGARALTTAEAPELELPDLDGNLFRLSSLKGQKVLIFAWAPY